MTVNNVRAQLERYWKRVFPVIRGPYNAGNRVLNRGPIGAYRRIHGGDLAAMIAFNALLALVP
ncbi:MAG: hypothetical protein M3Y37_11785, partial [Chloroflexota bacterium]|nr:hypothetical protein [Chloroflexota bacterium]